MQHAFEGPPTSSKPRVLGFLSPRWSVLMPGDVECSKGGSRCHGQRNVGGDVLPVSLPDGVQEELLELVRTPATRMMVHMIVSTVRQRVDAKTSFCDIRTLNL